MPNMREILTAASDAADYNDPRLQEQSRAVDLVKLGAIMEEVIKRAVIYTHAIDMMEAGLCPHPMQAFVHAANCADTGVTLTDSQFFSMLSVWGRMLERSQKEGVAASDPAFQEFYNKFVRNEDFGPFIRKV